jgi:hypothetical protein
MRAAAGAARIVGKSLRLNAAIPYKNHGFLMPHLLFADYSWRTPIS